MVKSTLSIALGVLPILAAQARPHYTSAVDSSIVMTTVSASQASSCLQSGFLGSYGTVSGSPENIFLADNDCITSSFQDEGALMEGEGSIFPFSATFNNCNRRLIWVGESGVQGKIHDGKDPRKLSTEVWNGIQAGHEILASVAPRSIWTDATRIVMQALGIRQSASEHQDQLSVPGVDFVHVGARSILLSVDVRVLPHLDSLIPSHLSLVALPEEPLPYASSSYGPSVPKVLVDNLIRLTKKLKFSPEIDEIISKGIDKDLLKQDILWLTGEREDSDIESRHSFTSGAREAANWIRDKVQATGAECILAPFLPGFSPNVICTYPSLNPNNTELVILSGHYDSRGSFGRIRAPGGDDDGSGTGHVLAIANAIAKYKVRFEKTVQLVLFAGEEQGLFGSAAYAKQLHNEQATILLQTQADMLGYHNPNEPMQLGLPESIGTPEAAWLVGNISNIYSPELVVGTTAACCSDHQSFVGYGFPATHLFERNGWIADPMYHNSGDLALREGYDFDQIYSIAKVSFATLLEVAGYSRG